MSLKAQILSEIAFILLKWEWTVDENKFWFVPVTMFGRALFHFSISFCFFCNCQYQKIIFIVLKPSQSLRFLFSFLKKHFTVRPTSSFFELENEV